jgi:hypothetical protein
MNEPDSPDLPAIPETLEEAVDQIVSVMDETTKVQWRAAKSPEFTSNFHFGGGMSMRNGWGLWHHKTPLSRWLLERRIFHGDDASQVIFNAVWRRLKGLSIDDAWLAERAAFYEDYWARTAGLTWDQKPIPGWKAPKNGWKYRRNRATGEWEMERDDGDEAESP